MAADSGHGDDEDAGRDAGSGEPKDSGSDDPPFDAGFTKSVKNWVKCDGTTDDSVALAAAFAAAKNGAFTLDVDCPVRMKVGMDIERAIFIEEKTTVEFTGNGKLIVDNALCPAFVIANSNDVTLRGWQVEYLNGIPADWKTGGFYENGTFVSSAANAPPAGAFNDRRLNPWLVQHRAIVFDQSQGNAPASWTGPTNLSSIFYIYGSTTNLNVDGMNLFVPATAKASEFIPMAFSMTAGFKTGQTANANTPYSVVPNHLTFTNIDIDGSLMGWQGNSQYLTINHLRSHRYADLQDANGGNVGGVGKWFAPPHLLYLNYNRTGDPALFNKELHISDVIDEGLRLGTARDLSVNAISGYANSLKIGGDDSTVDNYQSYRPDGFLQIFTSKNLTISNVTATFDSSFLNNVWPGMYSVVSNDDDVTLKNITLTDLAANSIELPFRGDTNSANMHFTFTNVNVNVGHWASNTDIVPNFVGSGHDIHLFFTEKTNALQIDSGRKSTLTWELSATNADVRIGVPTAVRWSTTGASSCTASGGWSGALATTGSKNVTFTTVGSSSLVMTCVAPGGASGTATLTLNIVQ